MHCVVYIASVWFASVCVTLVYIASVLNVLQSFSTKPRLASLASPDSHQQRVHLKWWNLKFDLTLEYHTYSIMASTMVVVLSNINPLHCCLAPFPKLGNLDWNSEITQKSLRAHSENTQRRLRDDSETTQRRLRDDSKNTQRSLREHLLHWRSLSLNEACVE